MALLHHGGAPPEVADSSPVVSFYAIRREASDQRQAASELPRCEARPRDDRQQH